MTNTSERKIEELLQKGSPCLQSECVTFTGTLASMTHKQAMELVTQNGGTPTTSVSQQTTMLVVGEEGWPLDDDGQTSQKLQQTQERQEKGQDCKILNESEWLHLLGLEERRREFHSLFTPAMLSKLLNVPVSKIRAWEKLQLIEPVRKVYRLPYFDFQEVASVRSLAELIESGASTVHLKKSLQRLNGVLDGIERPLAQLEMLCRNSRLLYRDGRGLVEADSGQRFLDFFSDEDEAETDGKKRKSPREVSPVVIMHPARNRMHGNVEETQEQLRWSSKKWYREGCRLLAANRTQEAVEAFRLSLIEDPANADAHFNLAEALYRLNNLSGALERYYSTVEIDENFIEAWTQLGCVYSELGEYDSAMQALEIALEVHEEYPDAHWHLADILYQIGRHDEAVPHWKMYLDHDRQSPWAETARQRLLEANVIDE